MRMLKRNKQSFYYAQFIEKRPVTTEDEWGNKLQTGEWETIYGNPVALKANISAAKGETETRIFGEDLGYDKVIVLKDVPIDEFSILWIDTAPILDDDGATQTPHDYVMRKVARSINSVSIAVSKVNVSMGASLDLEPLPINIWNDSEMWDDSDIWND